MRSKFFALPCKCENRIGSEKSDLILEKKRSLEPQGSIPTSIPPNSSTSAYEFKIRSYFLDPILFSLFPTSAKIRSALILRSDLKNKSAGASGQYGSQRLKNRQPSYLSTPTPLCKSRGLHHGQVLHLPCSSPLLGRALVVPHIGAIFLNMLSLCEETCPEIRHQDPKGPAILFLRSDLIF